MNEQITISALYDLNETIAADIFKDCTYPWATACVPLKTLCRKT